MKKFFRKIGVWLQRYWQQFSHGGLFIGVIFFAFSMTPSLLPRPPILQGLLAGLVFAVGYGMGVGGLKLWRYFELHEFNQKHQKWTCGTLHVIGFFIIAYAIFNWRMWQNSILSVMDQPIMEGYHFVFIVLFTALIVAILLIALGRLTRRWFRWLMNKSHNVVPRRISRVAGFISALILLIVMITGVFVSNMYDFVDQSAGQANNLTDDGVTQPIDPMKVGSQDSLIAWDTLGKAGRNFVSVGPSAEEIATFTGKDAKEPIRVYAGLQSADSYEERAQLVFDEMLRVGAFDRSVLIVTTPTGTGWMDPYAMDTLEYLHGGDSANVSMQYSYLSSQATLVFHPDKAGLSAKALFEKVYKYWTTLPQESRPELYLFGISLGSFGSEQSAKLHQIMYDPIDGALWTGPPFVNQTHKELVDDRNEDSPYWLPTYEDGSLVRFTSAQNNLANYRTDWRGMRLIYLQYSSDPMVFFSSSLFLHSPQWLKDPRADDVSPMLSWHPIVTFFQIAFDLIVSVSAAPLGYGHNYAPEHYIDSWVELTDPQGWDEETINRLKTFSRGS